jgi:hypothetical protein
MLPEPQNAFVDVDGEYIATSISWTFANSSILGGIVLVTQLFVHG